jgi:hypothetical protein
VVDFTIARWVDIVYNLARFEDVEVTKAQAYELLVRGKSYNEIDGCSFHDSLVLKNIFSAYYYVSRYGNMGVDLGLLITDIHEIMVDNLMFNPLEIGTFRLKEGRISGTTYKPPVTSYSESLSWLVRETSSLVKVDDYLVLLIRLMKRQLFVDGNKRTAYVFVNYLLIPFGVLVDAPSSKVAYDVFLGYLQRYYEDDNTEKYFVNYLKRNYLKVY